MRISYVGSVFGSRNLAPVFTAAKELIARGTLDPALLDIHVVGHGAASVVSDAGTLPVSFTGFVEHAEAVREMRSASVLVFHLPPDLMAASGKIYEYLVSGRPILCVAHPDNVAYRLVEELGAGECADVRDPASVEVALERLVEKWKNGTLTLPDEVRREALRRFSRDKLAGDLAQLFRRVSGPSSAPELRPERRSRMMRAGTPPTTAPETTSSTTTAFAAMVASSPMVTPPLRQLRRRSSPDHRSVGTRAAHQCGPRSRFARP